jgi:hypothetical protein
MMTQDHIVHIMSFLVSQERLPWIMTDSRELNLSLMRWIVAMLNFSLSEHFAMDSYCTLQRQSHFKQHSSDKNSLVWRYTNGVTQWLYSCYKHILKDKQNRTLTTATIVIAQ